LLADRGGEARANLFVSAKLGEDTKLDLLDSPEVESYLPFIPIHRSPAAHSCARRFFRYDPGLSSDEMGRLAPRGAEEGY
jgi:hypothetical protein